MSDELIEQLRKDGVKYVRWTYCGSNDEGYIIDIKTFDSEEREHWSWNVYNGSLEGKGVHAQIQEYGEKIFDGLRGFEINDGGYGWILLNTDSGECVLSEHWNNLGVEAEGFPYDDFDRVVFSFNEDWDSTESNASAVDVIFCDSKSGVELSISDEQKCKFVSFDRTEGKKKRGDFFDRGGQLLCTVNGALLRDFITSIGQKSSSDYYYYSYESSSRTQSDKLKEISFAVSNQWDEHYLTVFTGGWSDSFRVSAMYESDLIERNPTPSELERGFEEV